MKIAITSSMLFSDTLIPDVFISEYLPEADGDYIKVYLYCLFMGNHGKKVQLEDVSKKTGVSQEKVGQAISYWENVGAMIRTEKGIQLCDLKEKEIHKLYNPKLPSLEKALDNAENNLKRSQVITAIANSFFPAGMSSDWYATIDSLFEKHKFEEDVMLSLFKYCYDRNKLSRNYLSAVAETWGKNHIRDAFDLDNYFIVYEKCNEIKKKICKKLSIYSPLTEYQEAYVEKWVTEYNFGFEIIELALKKTTSKSSWSFDYLHKILTAWHEAGLTSVETITAHIKAFKQASKETAASSATKNKFVGQLKNVDLSQFYDNLNT